MITGTYDIKNMITIELANSYTATITPEMHAKYSAFFVNVDTSVTIGDGTGLTFATTIKAVTEIPLPSNVNTLVFPAVAGVKVMFVH